jgi:hypothetical protein
MFRGHCHGSQVVWAGRRVFSGADRLLGRGGKAWKPLETSVARRSRCICNLLVDYF